MSLRARLVGAVVTLVLALIGFASGSSTSTTGSQHSYSLGLSSRKIGPSILVDDSRADWPESRSTSDRAYDDPLNLARASTRLDRFRSAPNTAASIADDVPAFARSQYGRVPAAERAAALERAPTCPYCGTSPSSQVDHIGALRRDWGAGGWADDFATRTGRVNDPGNLIGACASCNASKGARAIGEGAGQWWPSGWPSGSWWPFGGPT